MLWKIFASVIGVDDSATLDHMKQKQKKYYLSVLYSLSIDRAYSKFIKKFDWKKIFVTFGLTFSTNIVN